MPRKRRKTGFVDVDESIEDYEVEAMIDGKVKKIHIESQNNEQQQFHDDNGASQQQFHDINKDNFVCFEDAPEDPLNANTSKGKFHFLTHTRN